MGAVVVGLLIAAAFGSGDFVGGRASRDATTAAGATQVDVSLSSCVWMSRVQLRTLVKALDEMQPPVLVHCAWGAERTGLVSAIAELLREGGTLADARAQFALKYLYVPVGDGRIMSEAVDQYEALTAALNSAASSH